MKAFLACFAPVQVNGLSTHEVYIYFRAFQMRVLLFSAVVCFSSLSTVLSSSAGWVSEEGVAYPGGDLEARLPDGFSQIFRSYVVGPSGLKDYGSMATLQNLTPSFPWIAPPHALHPGAIQGKEGIKFCHLPTCRNTV